MTNSSCFSRDKLQQYLLGELADADSDIVALHVEECDECDATVTALDRESDTLIESLREPVIQDEAGTVYRLAAKRAVVQWRDADAERRTAASIPIADRRLRDYELIEPLAQGGMGTVYRARHSRLNRLVALKVLPGRWLKDPAVVARFEREMQAVGSLRHSAIVQATDGGDADGVYFLAMELVDGCDGSELVQNLGPLPVADACEIARQAAVGMAYAHDQGIIHRDLKPSNLMVTRDGETKVLDLGLARIVGEQLAEDELTTVGQLMGTLDFMAPEQLENSHAVDERADVYSLGATLYKLLTGVSPHTTEPREPLVSKLRRISGESPIPLHDRRDDAPPQLGALVDGMLSRDAAERPPSMQAVVEALASFGEDSDLARRVAEAIKSRKTRAATSYKASGGSRLENVSRGQGDSQDRLRGGGRWVALVAVGLFLIASALGVVITLQTMAGQLVIETATPDVKVTILKSGQPYRQLTLKPDANSLRLGAGQYEVVISGDSDGLVIQNGTYTLKRGDTWVARIVHSDSPTGAVESVSLPHGRGNTASLGGEPLPTYEGKTLDEWLALLRKERSPKQLYEACRALGKLATGDDTAKAVEALLVAVQFHDRSARYLTGGNAHILWSTVRMLLGSRDQRVVLAALNRELDRGNKKTQDFILYYLSYGINKRPFVDDRLLAQVERLTDADSPATREQALVVLQRIGSENAVARRLTAALSDSDASIQLLAARKLIEMRSSIPMVLSTLIRQLRTGELEQRAEAAWHLGDLGVAAKEALPDLIAIVNDDDIVVSQAAVLSAHGVGGPSSLGRLSLKDAAVRAVSELGDPSAAPTLLAEWDRRAVRRGGTDASTPSWKNRRPPNRSNTYTETWVGDAIEQLIGMRPSTGQINQVAVTIWKIRKRSLLDHYLYAFDEVRRQLPDSADAAEKLMPRASEVEVEVLSQRVSNTKTVPDAERLALQIKLIELLVPHEDSQRLLESVLSAWSGFARRSLDDWDSAEGRRTVVNTYRDTAIRLLRATPDWKSTSVSHLLELVKLDKNWPGAGAVLLEILPDLEEEQQPKAVVRLLQSFGKNGKRYYGDSMRTVNRWMDDEANRTAIRQQLELAMDDDFEMLAVGLIRSKTADAQMSEQLNKRFGDDSINRKDVFKWLFQSLDDEPDVAEVVIELMRHPALDMPTVVMVRGGTRAELSFRAKSFLPMLDTIPPPHRASFRPWLLALTESGKNGEDQAARRVLEAWK